MSDSPRSMEPDAAAEVLRRSLKNPKEPMTVADAAVASGLALRDAEAGLHLLTSEYRGHLRVTEDGDLVHVFPTGFSKPWVVTDRMDQIFASVGNAIFGVGRLIVRAWILVVMVGYAALFVALLVGLMFAQRGEGNRGRSPGLGFMSVIFRVLAEAAFWTFHPFSPFYAYDLYGAPSSYSRARSRQSEEPKVPFYERVNRFVFGPTKPPEDPNAKQAKVLAEIRLQKGRIGLADVMRVTGLPRSEADPLMAKLMLDYDGTVHVADVEGGGGIFYRFESLRRTAEGAGSQPPNKPAWATPKTLAPLTGNPSGTNVGIALLNGFNLLMGSWAIANGLTIANVILLFSKHRPPMTIDMLPNDGTAIALGVIPAVFSLALFALPILRALGRLRSQRKVEQENARLAVMREVLSRAPKKQPVSDAVLRKAIRVVTGHEPSSKEVTKRVVDLGGDVDMTSEGEVRYRFADLEAEAEALEEEREHASDEEAKIGKVVFASDN